MFVPRQPVVFWCVVAERGSEGLPERIAMIAFNTMRQFMCDHILDNPLGCEDEMPIQRDDTVFTATTPP